ncbi:MAG: hypothetical protein M3440_15000 [Chloroflexota bacterium]|nr:hypothetical protein [Chloroflexota bacterium]
MPFKEFKREDARLRNPSPTISINGGVSSLNKASVTALGEPTHVVLLWDSDEQVIGLRAADASDIHAYALSKASAVPLKTFMRHFGIPQTGKLRLTGRLDGDVLVFPLHQSDEESS